METKGVGVISVASLLENSIDNARAQMMKEGRRFQQSKGEDELRSKLIENIRSTQRFIKSLCIIRTVLLQGKIKEEALVELLEFHF